MIGDSKPGIGAMIGNALLSVFRAILLFCAKICLQILKELGLCLLTVIGFVAGVIVESIIELRWLLITTLALMVIVFLWKQSMHRSDEARALELGRTPDRLLVYPARP